MAKLVRDKIPQIIRENGQTPTTHIADQQEYKEALLTKLREEINEFITADTREQKTEELADVFEVLDAIRKSFEINEIDVAAVKVKKAKERGRFEKRIILDTP